MKIYRFLERIKAFPGDVKEFSVGVAWGRFQRGLPFVSWEKRRTAYEKSILYYLDHEYGALIDSFESNLASKPVSNMRIWTMWWQGIEQMPPIVRACYNRMSYLFQNDLVLITGKNYTDWVTLPDHIIKKHTAGLISTTHLSDIVRAELLRKYGGAWIDATIYLDHMPEETYKYDFFTLHAPGMFPEFISRGSWSPFFFSCNTGNYELFSLLSLLFLSYWEQHTQMVDYLLIDYFIKLILCHKPEISATVDEVPENRCFYSLNLEMNEEYDKERIHQIFQMSPVQKLTYKKEYRLLSENGLPTNVAKIIEGTLFING